MSRSVWFKSPWLELPSGTYIGRCPDWQRPELERLVEKLRNEGTLPEAEGRGLGGGAWELCVRGLGQVTTHRCWLRDDHPEPHRASVSRPEWDVVLVRVPEDRWIEASEFLENVQRPEDRERLGGIFTRLLRGEPVRPHEAQQVEESEWEVQFPVKFAGRTAVRIRLGTTDPNWGRPGT